MWTIFIHFYFIHFSPRRSLPSVFPHATFDRSSKHLFTRVKHSDTRGLGLNRQVDLVPIHRGTYTHACLLGCLSFRSRIVTSLRELYTLCVPVELFLLGKATPFAVARVIAARMQTTRAKNVRTLKAIDVKHGIGTPKTISSVNFLTMFPSTEVGCAPWHDSRRKSYRVRFTL